MALVRSGGFQPGKKPRVTGRSQESGTPAAYTIPDIADGQTLVRVGLLSVKKLRSGPLGLSPEAEWRE